MKTWLDLFPLLRLPTIGSYVQPIAPVTSWFSPTIEVNYKGDPTIERDVVTSVAGYGSQLGTLIDAVAESAGGKSGPAMQRLFALKSAIDSVKSEPRRGCQPGALRTGGVGRIGPAGVAAGGRRVRTQAGLTGTDRPGPQSETNLGSPPHSRSTERGFIRPTRTRSEKWSADASLARGDVAQGGLR
jgi:hypothetical protein